MFVFWNLSVSNFLKQHDVSEAGSVALRIKKHSNVVDPLRLSYSESLGTTETVNLLRYAPENASSPAVVTGKWPLKNKKLIRLEDKAWTNPQIKNHKSSHELKLIIPQTQHKNPEHMYLKVSTPLTLPVKKTESYSQVDISL
jgi:hypothetical protein